MNQRSFHLLCPSMNWRLIYIMLVAVVFCCSCKKNPEPLFSQGMITGYIYTNDGSKATNTKVIAHGPYGSPSTLSDTNGDYTLSGLGNGTYEIEFDKEGYGKKFARGVRIFGKDTIKENKRLIKKADYQMPELSTVLYSNSYTYMDEYSVAIVTNKLWDNNGNEMQIRVFISDEKDVSPTNYMYSEQAREVKRENNTSLMMVCVNPQIVNSDSDHLFNEGQTIYLIAYVCSIDENLGEFNEYYGVPIFSTADEQQHSQVIELKAP